MTGGSFTNEDSCLVISTQPKTISRRESECKNKSAFNGPFDDAHCERNWSSGICACKTDKHRNGKFIYVSIFNLVWYLVDEILQTPSMEKKKFGISLYS